MNLLPDNLFPPSIHGLLRTISRAGFFDRSVMIGSWVMLVYQELYGVTSQHPVMPSVFHYTALAYHKS